MILIVRLYAVLRIRDLVPFVPWIRDPGWVKNQVIRIRDEYFGSYFRDKHPASADCNTDFTLYFTFDKAELDFLYPVLEN